VAWEFSPVLPLKIPFDQSMGGKMADTQSSEKEKPVG
jgi:hypothetical protein